MLCAPPYCAVLWRVRVKDGKGHLFSCQLTAKKQKLSAFFIFSGLWGLNQFHVSVVMSAHLSGQMFQRSQVSGVVLCMSKVKVPSVSESAWVTIELFWTAKKELFLFIIKLEDQLAFAWLTFSSFGWLGDRREGTLFLAYDSWVQLWCLMWRSVKWGNFQHSHLFHFMCIIQGEFFNCSHPISVPKRKLPISCCFSKSCY